MATKKRAPKKSAKKAKSPARSGMIQLLLGIACIGLAALLFYLAITTPEENTAMSNVKLALRGIGGGLAPILPLIFVWIGILLLASGTGRRLSGWKIALDAVMLQSVFAAVELFWVQTIAQASPSGYIFSYPDFLSKAYKSGLGGGALGGLTAWPLYRYVGAWGGLIVLIVLFVILLAAEGRLTRLAGWLDERWKAGADDREARRAERQEDREARKAERAALRQERTEDYDIDHPFAVRAAPEKPVKTPARTRPARTRTEPRREPDQLYREDIVPSTQSPEPFAAQPEPIPEATSYQDPYDEPAAVPEKKRGASRKKSKTVSEEAAFQPDADYAHHVSEEAPEEDSGIFTPVGYEAHATEEPEAPEPEEDTSFTPINREDLRIEPDEYEQPDEDIPEEGIVKTLPKLKRVEESAEEESEPYNYPPLDLLPQGDREAEVADEEADLKKAKQLEETLKSFGIATHLTGIAHGPAVTRFELKPAPGVKVSRITQLADDIALNLAAIRVRIEAPIPGKSAVGVEIPNDKVETVPLRDVLESNEARKHPSKIAVALGKDNSGRYIVADIGKMPHVLIAGQTGSGKSVCINSLIISILYRATPDEVKMILIDPKVVELSVYNDIPHLISPVVTDPKKAASALQWAVSEMEGRYKKFAERNVRNIKGYNASLKEGEKPMPHMVIIIDELADLMMVSPGEVEDSICRLAQLARAAGMHLVIATQRPSVNVITGIIKANIPTRIAFLVASQVDSRTIIDHGGAEKLLGYGDMLFVPSGAQKSMRVQGAWVSDEEVNQVVEYIKARHESTYDEDMVERINLSSMSDAEREETLEEYDPRLPEAVEIVIEAGQASISMLQRRMRVGYARAGRLIDDMAQRGIVSEAGGSKPREVLITREQFQAMFEETA